jgi:hypothetical protein
MRSRSAHSFFLTMALLFCGLATGQAQDSATDAQLTSPANHGCPKGAVDEEAPAPNVMVADVTFLGSFRLPVADQQEIAEMVKRYASNADHVVDESLEKVRAGWQDRGYFKVLVTGEATTLSASLPVRVVALRFTIDEGPRYNLKTISFEHNKAIRDSNTLRSMFGISDGEIFSREKIAHGLEHLREAYGELGYINFTAVPDAKVDDSNQLISVVVDMDEGRQFHVGQVEVIGLDDAARDQVLQDFGHPGDVVSNEIWEKLFVKYGPQTSDCACHPNERRLDEKAGLVSLRLDFRPCSEP